MLRKYAAIIAFCAGAWAGHRYALDVIDYYGLGTDYWSEIGAQFIRVFFAGALGGLSALVVYFAINLFSRFD